MLRKVETERALGYTLEDGTQLQMPAGALPTQGAEVNLAIQPSTSLPVDAFFQPAGHAYRDAEKTRRNLHNKSALFHSASLRLCVKAVFESVSELARFA